MSYESYTLGLHIPNGRAWKRAVNDTENVLVPEQVPITVETTDINGDLENEDENVVTTRPQRVEQEQSNDAHLGRTASGRPSGVTKLFPRELKYTGSSTEPLRRRFKTFLNAVGLCNIGIENSTIMFPLLETSFLAGQALYHYQDNIRGVANTIEEAIDILENHFLGQRARRVNDEIWSEISYEYVKKKSAAENKSSFHEAVLSELLTQITYLSDIRTGPGSDNIIMAKTIAAVCKILIFSVVYQNPPDNMQDLNAALRSCTMEADRVAIQSGLNETADKKNGIAFKTEIQKMIGDRIRSYYIDRESRQRGRNFSPGPRSYGRSRSNSPSRRIPRHICIICAKSGCLFFKTQTCGQEGCR